MCPPQPGPLFSHSPCLGAVSCSDNSYKQLGNNGTGLSSVTPVAVLQGSLIFSQISSGEYFTCALTDLGLCYCWGGGVTSPYALGTNVSQALAGVPTAILGSATFSQLSVGELTVIGILGTPVLPPPSPPAPPPPPRPSPNPPVSVRHWDVLPILIDVMLGLNSWVCFNAEMLCLSMTAGLCRAATEAFSPVPQTTEPSTARVAPLSPQPPAPQPAAPIAYECLGLG